MPTTYIKKFAVLSAGLFMLGIVTHVASGNAVAQPGNPLQSILALLQDPAFGLAEIKSEIQAIEAQVPRLEMQVAVDTAACASVPVQCGDGGTGHSFQAASSANHNPVRLGVLVTLNGAPVPALAADSFDFSNQFVPAGGSAVVLCPAGGAGCASGSLFQNGGDGTYSLWAHPGTEGDNWKAGSYFGRLRVVDANGNTASALVHIVIS